jgi:hypothetical protein
MGLSRLGLISCPVEYLYFGQGKAEGRRQEAGGRRQEAGGRRQEAGGRRQEAGGRRQEAGGRRQEAGGRRQEAGGEIVEYIFSLSPCSEVPLQLYPSTQD